MICKHCGKPIVETEGYACLWGRAKNLRLSVVGFLHLACSDHYQNAVEAVAGKPPGSMPPLSPEGDPAP